MVDYEFVMSTQVYGGNGRSLEIGEKLRGSTDKVLLVYGGGSIKKTGIYEKVTHSLKENGIAWEELSGVRPNPSTGKVKEGIMLCRDKNIRYLLAVGGGSVIDTAKSIAIGVDYPGDVWDFYSGKAEVTGSLPVASVLTIPGTGSESSANSVLSNLAHNWVTGIGREQDWSGHPLEEVISGLYSHLPHGAGLSIVTPAWMRYVYRKHLPMFVQFAVNVMGARGELKNPERTALEGIEELEDFSRRMKLPLRFSEVGIDDSQFEWLAKRCCSYHKGDRIGKMEPIGWEDVVRIYRSAL